MSLSRTCMQTWTQIDGQANFTEAIYYRMKINLQNPTVYSHGRIFLVKELKFAIFKTEFE